MDKIIETILKHKQKELTSLIAIDIADAFDNAWWPAIIKRMDNDDVPSDLIRIIKSYLNNEREVKFTYESETFYEKLTKGCPQGGPLSPLLWNILLNDLLINFDSMNADIICYADDVTIICWNKTIEGLKTASEYTLNYVIQWCNRNKLTISTEKTNMLYLHNRQKIPIKVNNNIIMPVKQVKILGMKFSNHKWKNKVNFTPHVNDILCKAGRMKNLLCSLSGNMWGLDTQKRLTLFKTIIRPVLTYGSEIWFKYLNNRCKQKLNSMQYQIILWAVRAYKTTSSNCVHSLAKIPLLTEFIESRIIKFDQAQLSIEDLITYEPHAPSIVKSFLHAKMNENFENTNEIFRSFFVLGIPRFFHPNFYNIQFITDHGNFGKFLATIGAVKEPGCFCGGEIQDARHLLLECPIFRDFRENRFGRIGQLDEFVDKKKIRYVEIIFDDIIENEHIASKFICYKFYRLMAIDEIITKTNRASGYLIGLTGKAWGLDSKRRIELYKTLFRSSLTYGSTIWYNFIPKKVKDKLNSLQYKILKHSTQVYNSTSSNCTHIVARTPKLTDFIETNILKMNIGYKKSDPTKRKMISNFINQKFEEYYGGANDNFKGFFDTSRIPNYVQPNFYNVQFFTGHGDFNTYLFRIGKIGSPACTCGNEQQTPEHLLIDCPLTSDLREENQLYLTNRKQAACNKDQYIKFNRFCR
ncbi:hypothetical protein LAZ67_21000927, partial [Cordylochernes scorpioides]